MEDIYFITILEIHSEWPPKTDQITYEVIDENSIFQIWIISRGHLHIVFSDPDGDNYQTCDSSMINIEGLGTASAMITVLYRSLNKKLKLQINGLDSVPGDTPIVLSAKPSALDKISEITTIDSLGIEDALRRRAQRKADYKRNGLTDLQTQQLWSGLECECRLLNDAIVRLSEGNTDQLGPISLNIRKMIGPKAGDNLIQKCASLISASLPIWTRPVPDPGLFTLDQLPSGAVVFSNGDLFTTQPLGFNTEMTDIDIWLKRKSEWIACKNLSNLEIVLEISDKIGAHWDVNNRITVDFLQSMSINKVDELSRYLFELGSRILSVAMMLVEKRTNLNL